MYKRQLFAKVPCFARKSLSALWVLLADVMLLTGQHYTSLCAISKTTGLARDVASAAARLPEIDLMYHRDTNPYSEIKFHQLDADGQARKLPCENRIAYYDLGGPGASKLNLA